MAPRFALLVALALAAGLATGQPNASAWSCCHQVAGDNSCRKCSTYSNLNPCIYDDSGHAWDVLQIICEGSSNGAWEESGKPGGYTPLQEDWFRDTPHLEKLVITGFLIKPLPSTLFQLSELVHLELAYNDAWSEEPPESLERLGQLKNLQTLRLPGNPELASAIPASLAKLPKLNFFGFQGSPLCGDVPDGVDCAPPSAPACGSGTGSPTPPTAVPSATPAPSATDAPTDPPSATDAPTDPPSATDAPTDPPSATDAPTDGPPATTSPTSSPTRLKPTHRPTAEKPTLRPTAEPTPETARPTARPTASPTAPTTPAPTSATESQTAYCGPVLVEVPERGPLFATGVALSGLAALVALVAALVLAVGTIRRAQRFSAAAPRLVALLALFAIALGALLGTVNLYEPDKSLCAAESWLVLVGEAVLTSALAAIVVTGRAKGARIAAAVACALVLAVVLALAAVYTADGAAPDPCYSYSCGSGALRTAMLVVTSAAAALLALAACMAWRRPDARARMASCGGASGLRSGATALAAVVVAVLAVLYAVLATTLSGAVDVPASQRLTSVSASTQPRLAAVLFSAACLGAAATLAHAMLRHVVREGKERQEDAPRWAFPFGPNKYLDHRQSRAASKQAKARAVEEGPEDAGTPPLEGLQVDDLERELEQMAGAWGAAYAAKELSPAPAPTPSPAAQERDLEQMAGLWGRTSRSANAPAVARISSGLGSAQHANTADANQVVLVAPVAPVAPVASWPLMPEHAQPPVELELGVCAGADGLETALAESERQDHAAPVRQPELSAEDWAEVGFRVGVDRGWEEYIHRNSGDPFWINVRTREVKVTPPFNTALSF
jgi:hypothetical protein